MAWEASFTDAGITMMGQLAGGAVLTLTKALTYKDNPDTSSQDAYVAVSTGSMSRKLESDGAVVKIRVFSYDEAYTMTQIGIFGKVGSGAEQLFATLQNSDGIEILSKTDFPDFAFNVSLFIKSSFADNISVSVDTQALVSVAQLAAATSHFIDVVRTYNALTSSTSCPFAAGDNKSYLVWTSGDGTDGIMDEEYGSLFFVSSGKYATIHKGSKISVNIYGGNFIVSSTTSVTMAVVEL